MKKESRAGNPGQQLGNPCVQHQAAAGSAGTPERSRSETGAVHQGLQRDPAIRQLGRVVWESLRFAESGGKRCPDGSQQSRNLRKADRTASDKESRNGSTVMIPKFYEDWRQEADRQEILAQQEAERQHRRELLDDILLYVGIPLLVAAVLVAPTVMQAVFG